MVQVWQLASIVHELRMLNKSDGVLDASGIGKGSCLLSEEAFNRLFPFGWKEEELYQKDGTERTFNYDGIKFSCIRLYKDMAERLIEEERQDRERQFWDVGLDPERNGGDYDG